MRDYIFQLRKEKQITQEMLSRITGMSQQYCSFIEAGDRQQDMGISIMEKLAKAFDIPLQKIMEYETEYRAGHKNNPAR